MAAAAVRALLDDSPEWLARQLRGCKANPDRYIGPTSHAVASAVYRGDFTDAQYKEVRGVLVAYLDELRREVTGGD